jgi:hypothetical protein
VKLLLENGADVRMADRNGCTPLHVACYIGALASVKSLLAAGCRIDELDERGHTALHKVFVFVVVVMSLLVMWVSKGLLQWKRACLAISAAKQG